MAQSLGTQENSNPLHAESQPSSKAPNHLLFTDLSAQGEPISSFGSLISFHNYTPAAYVRFQPPNMIHEYTAMQLQLTCYDWFIPEYL